MADILILTLTLTLLSLCLLLLFLSNSHKTKSPPGPKPWPILGNLPDLLPHRGCLHRFLSDLSRLHGPLLTLRRGSSPLFVASTPASASAVLRTHDRSLCGRHVPAAFRCPAYIPSTFIWSTTLDERWRSVRSLCKSELFSSMALDAGSAERERLAARMVEGVRGRAGTRVDVREGCGVMVNVWAIGRDPDAWGNAPEEFCPERFIDHHDECGVDFKGSHFKFLPFGSGRRACVGMPLGHRMIQLVVASLVRNFDWGLPDGGMADQLDMDDWFELTLERKRALVLIPSEVGAC
ncbi:hypothetical protein QJS04_geneDACA000949 [Acorus gramineus]|uniref:Cytochrome P450 n=1 Tax=Acorus gramineus TaxID=55184 RepID=A0AAV9ACS2_ACOGR|nr:hypothetical protein QJS04_geneDACA000949 [Acorus gramineus]